MYLDELRALTAGWTQVRIHASPVTCHSVEDLTPSPAPECRSNLTGVDQIEDPSDPS